MKIGITMTTILNGHSFFYIKAVQDRPFTTFNPGGRINGCLPMEHPILARRRGNNLQ